MDCFASLAMTGLGQPGGAFGEEDRDFGAFAVGAGEVQAAVMGFHQLLGDGQAEAGAVGMFVGFGFELNEGFQRFGQVLLPDADAVVADGEAQAGMTGEAGAEFDAAAGWREFDRVAE